MKAVPTIIYTILVMFAILYGFVEIFFTIMYSCLIVLLLGLIFFGSSEIQRRIIDNAGPLWVQIVVFLVLEWLVLTSDYFILAILIIVEMSLITYLYGKLRGYKGAFNA